MKEINIRLDEKLNLKLEILANKIGVPKNALIKMLLFNYLSSETKLNLWNHF